MEGERRVKEKGSQGLKKVVKKSGKSQAKNSKFNRALSMNPTASNVVNDHSLDYPLYSQLTMRVTETMGRVRGGTKKKAVKV